MIAIPPTKASAAAASVVTCIASTYAEFAGSIRNRPAGPRCSATAWVAETDWPASARAAGGSAASVGDIVVR